MAAEWNVVIGQEAGHGGRKRKNLCLALEKFPLIQMDPLVLASPIFN